MKQFLRYTLPWILAAAVLIAVPVAIKSSHYGFGTIEFHSPQPAVEETEKPLGEYVLVLNESTGKIHLPDCRYAKSMNEEARKEITTDDIEKTVRELELKGYSQCRVCMGKNE